MKRLLSRTVWAKGALDHEPKKFRSLWRVWLPAYDLFAIGAGVSAVVHGSTLLNRIFGEVLTDIAGWGFTAVALSCLICVSFPALWKLEMVSKSVLVGMVVAYIYCILFLPTPAQIAASGAPNYFVGFMLAFGLPLALFRLNQLADEQYERRVRARVEALIDTGEITA